MSEKEWRRDRPFDEALRRRMARVVPVPEQKVDDGTALVIILVSATIAVVTSALATTLF